MDMCSESVAPMSRGAANVSAARPYGPTNDKSCATGASTQICATPAQGNPVNRYPRANSTSESASANKVKDWLKGWCTEKWPDDYRMQEYYCNEQVKVAHALCPS